MNLIVFTTMGRTFNFQDVTNFGYTAQGIEFDYMGGVTGTKRHANFNNTSMVGYSTTEAISSSSR